MAFRFEFDDTNRILQCRFEGRVTDEGLTSFYRQAGEFVASLDPRGGIVDWSEVISFEVSVETIRRLAKLPPAMPQIGHPRIIVAHSSQIFGMARMFEFEGEITRPNLHVVRSLAEAWAILGIREPRFEPVSELFDSSNEDVGPQLLTGE
jgi:hypothetical protein